VNLATVTWALDKPKDGAEAAYCAYRGFNVIDAKGNAALRHGPAGLCNRHRHDVVADRGAGGKA
jgi:hypothetical protein